MQKVLNVPYFVQPTSNTCQSTCLKMFASYLSGVRGLSSQTEGMSIQDIWNKINTDNARPSKTRNAYENMAWWLNTYFAPTKFSTLQVNDEALATEHVVKRIDHGYPVMVSTNHLNTKGHIILVIGYDGYTPNQCTEEFGFICHDPYGKFHPQLNSKDWGKTGRYRGGSCLSTGGESGPGKGVKYDINGIRRVRQDQHSPGTFYLLSAQG